MLNRLLFLAFLLSSCGTPPETSRTDAAKGDASDAGARDAGAPDLIDTAFDLSKITLVTGQTRNGYDLEYYENRAYTCGRQGFQTFLVASSSGLPRSTTRPLWVRMHGGGIGAYDAAGAYVPPEGEIRNDQESLQYLEKLALEPGLMQKILSDPAGFRLLFPSFCDHDAYSGVGLPDANNPNNPDELGARRVADGLLSTKAAIAFTRDRFSSSHVFLHGTSSGAIGAFGVAYALERQGVRLSGAIVDSHILGTGIDDNAALGCMPRAYPSALFKQKVGPLARPAHDPVAVVLGGRITVPIYHLWNRGDPSCCGATLRSYSNPGGTPYTEIGCDHEHRPFFDAILARPPGGPGVSRSVELCVNNARTTRPDACNLHSPTKYLFSARSPAGDQLSGGGDFNQGILDWVHARLNDPPP